MNIAKNAIFSVLLSIVILFFSFSTVSEINLSLISGNTTGSEMHVDSSFLTILDVEQNHANDVVAAIVEWANQNDSLIIKRDYEESKSIEKYFVSANKNYYNSLIINSDLKASELINIYLNNYSNNNKLFTFNSNSIEIYPLSYISQHSNVNDMYMVFSSIENLSILVSSIKEISPMINVDYDITNGMFSPIQVIFVDYILFLGSLLTLFFIGILHNILKQAKRISIEKIEGFSNLNLLTKYVVKDVMVVLLLSAIIVLAISIVKMPINANNSFTLYKIIFLHFFMWIISNIFCIAIFSSIFPLFNPATTIKGQNILGHFNMFLNLIRIICLVALVVMIIPTSNFIYKVIRIEMSEQEKLDSFENIVLISSIKPQYMNYYNDVVLFNDDKLIDYFIDHNQLFDMEQNILDYETMEKYIEVDMSYLVNEELWKDEFSNKTVLFLFNEMKAEELDRLKIMFSVDDVIYLEEITNYSIFASLSPYNLDVKMKDIDDIAFMIYPNSKDEYDIILNRYFFYNGNDAQEYVDGILKNYGYAPYINVESFENMYNYYKNIYYQENLSSVFSFTIIFIAYLYSALIYYTSWVQANSKKLFLNLIEGKSKIKIFSDLIIYDLSILMLIDMMIIMVVKLNTIHTLLLISIIMCGDMIIKYIYIRGINVRKVRELL